jgi:hypothetical protein
MPEGETQARPRSIGLQLSIYRWNKSIEEHLLYTHMIMEVFDVPEFRNCTADMHVK